MATSFFTSPEAKAFYQRRVATFGLILGVAGAVGLAFRVVIAVASGTLHEKLTDPGYWLHAAAIVPCLAMWLFARRGARSHRSIVVVETAGILLACIGYIGMGTTIPPEVGADTITAFALAFIFFARAVFIPSTARHTVGLGVLVGIPLVVIMTLHYRNVEPAMWQMVGYETRGSEPASILVSTALMTTMWWTLTIGLSAIASFVIHSLRREVRAVRSLGQYQLERKLGEGAMGVVYRATHGMLKRPTAVKLLRPELGGPEMHDLFRHEVQQTARLTHPNTIRVYDYGRTPDGFFYYAMELLDGASLRGIVDATGPQPIPRVIRILRDAALALDEAHQAGLIHRDIKPSNIMLAHQGGASDVVKIVDFGLVKRVRGEDERQIEDSSIQGTPHYLSPEGIEMPSEVDARSDIYALGAVGYYLLTGRTLFQAKTTAGILMAHLQTEPPAPSEARSEPVPEGLEQLILGCLAKNRADRPGSCEELANALDQLDIPAWTRADAEQWWEEHSSLVEEQRESVELRITGHTMKVVVDEPWSESADGGS